MYLTPELKAYYQKDFTDNVLNCKDFYWALHQDLVDLCKQANQNEHIQTIYSRKNDEVEDWSYLMFAADEKGEKQLLELGIKMISEFKQVSFLVKAPKKKFKGDKTNDLECNTNPKYFNVRVFCFECDSTKKKDHKEFWDFLTKSLVV
jgi:hypothetical protein